MFRRHILDKPSNCASSDLWECHEIIQRPSFFRRCVDSFGFEVILDFTFSISSDKQFSTEQLKNGCGTVCGFLFSSHDIGVKVLQGPTNRLAIGAAETVRV